ncbi:class I SAM-dependent methyltransferase [Methanocaldococcus infernus]
MDVEEFYKHYSLESLPSYVREIIKFVDERIMEEIKVEGFILDAGCGFGTFYEITKNYETIYLDICLEQLKRFPIDKNKVCADIENLPFKDESFDTILCINVLEHTNHEKALKELFRVLKRGGRLVVIVVNKDSFFKEPIFFDFRVKHEPLSLEDFKEFKIINYYSLYFLPSFIKILPTSILKRFLKFYKRLDKILSRKFKRGGQFLIVEMVKV